MRHLLIIFAIYRQPLKLPTMVLDFFLPEAVLSKSLTTVNDYNILLFLSTRSVITLPHTRLHKKKHNILLYHSVYSMIALWYISLHYLYSEFYITNVLSKRWGHQGTYNLLLKPIIRYMGNVRKLFKDDDIYVKQKLFT